MPKKFILYFFTLFSACTFGQVPDQLIFNRIDRKDGLSSNTVFQVVRDKQGFLWIATQNGLQRFDSNRFLTFRHVPLDSTTIAENSIKRLYIDSKDRLWLVFDKHIGIFNRVTFKYTDTRIKGDVNMIKKIMEDEQGRMVIFADYNKPFLYDEKQQVFTPSYPLPHLPAGFTFGEMAIDTSSGTYWLTGKQGSLLYDPNTKKVEYPGPGITHQSLPDSFLSVKNAKYPFIAKGGSYWMVNWAPFTGVPPVLYHFDKKTNKLEKFEKIRAYKADSYYEIWGVFQQTNGTIWIYGMGLLAYYSQAENRFIHINSKPFQENGIDYDLISNLYEDKEKNVWVSSNKGLYRFNTDAQVFRHFSNRRLHDTTLMPNTVSGILETQQDGIWIATAGGGIFSYDNEFKPIPNPVTAAGPLNKSLHARSMMQRRNGEIWIGLQSGGLKIYETTTGKCYTFSHPLLNGSDISQLLEDHLGNTWIGTGTGLLVKCEAGNWKDSTQTFKTLLTGLTDVMKLYEDANGHVWVCTSNNGVLVIDPGNGRRLKDFKETNIKKNGLLDDGANDVIQYNDSIFLIASNGLCVLNDRSNSFKYLTVADGLPAENITTLTLDKKKRLWVALDGGLYRLNINNKLYVTYDAADGITNDIFQITGNALLKDGRIVLGTPGGFMVFDPEKTIDRKGVPPVVITGFAVGGRHLSTDSLFKTDKLVLGENNSFINIELSTLSFRDRYYMYYMLEGLDKTWKRVYNNGIVYQYLPPGKYTLKLKAKNGEGEESSRVTALQIHITPPFWKSWWFYCLLALVAGGLLFWLDRERMKRKEAMQKMRSNIADGLHQDINEALGNINILSEMAKMKADNEPQKSKEFIEQIHTKSHNMIIAMDDILWSIHPENDRMENFMLRFREYIEALKNRHGVQIELLVDKKVDALQLNMMVRKEVFWLFKGGIANVIKSGAGNCKIHIAYEKNYLIYTLEFENGNVDMQQLNNLRQRKELSDKLAGIDGKLDFRVHKTKSVFELSIPAN
jgi:ligand-binding sensor domain-containing protein